ncbi:uroporphyrinogen decarboxylase [Dictyobacter formicarum]|uniref:Uroporphyrinogen decarboxylase n=1 Tax=Dictyobacter formicarum TaxID=2778368 RepID=A0ABQ3VKN6_9CHLR|nr:uroporphyrinogen decarboxylase [Dictyobacter formicarum]GHO86665.1 uroporphyrinogen decarboxylase [Dictyobacter formicarum]
MQQDRIPASTAQSPHVPSTGVARFLAACRHEQPDATPIWFMRQAGRSSKGYQELREKYDVLTLIKTPELCAQMTIMPVESFGVDGAVLYADIMLPLEGMGIDFELRTEGPVIHNPIRSAHDVEALRLMNIEESVPYILEALRLVRRELEGKQAVIGVSGGPFTLACYMIEGKPSRDYATAKALMYSQPALWHTLMEKVTTVVTQYVLAEIAAGADVIQIFESWIGTLGPTAYRRFVLPYTQRIFAAIKQTGTPAIHFGTGAAALLESMAEAGGDVISVDWRVELDTAWERIGLERGIQGNLDPTLLLTSWPVVEAGMQDVLRRAANRPGHIFNLGHGIPMAADPDLLRRLVDAVHETTKR